MVSAEARPQAAGALRAGQLTELKSLDVLRNVPEEELQIVLDHCSFRAFEPATALSVEQSSGRYCYFVIHGTIWATIRDKDDHETLLSPLGRGDCFGEGPLFGVRNRCTAAYAETVCYVLQIKFSTLRDLLPRMPGLETALRSYYRRRLVKTTLARVPLFRTLSPLVRHAIAEQMVRLDVDRGLPVIRQHEPGDALYIIELGQVAVKQDGDVIAHLGEGDFFGEMSLFQARSHNATVQTLTPSVLLKLPGVDFRRLLLEQPELSTRIHEVVNTRLSEAAAMHSDQQRKARLEIMIGQGLLRGKQVLVRRPAMCPPGCRLCEQACGERFGHPRLQLNGVALGELEAVQACRQCQVGAECVEACPEAALSWTEDSVLVVNDRCTGCGQCVPACPYDSIQLVERDPTSRRVLPEASSLLQLIWRRGQQAAQQQVAHLASKCDLCAGYGDRACLSRCPTGSLQLVSIEELSI